MAFPDYAYDLYEDFEDGTRTGWTTVDPDTNVDEESAAQKRYGSQSCEIDTDGATGGKDAPYIYYNYGSGQSGNMSLGFWFYLPSITDTFWGPNNVFLNFGTAAGNPFGHILRVFIDCDTNVTTIWMSGDDSSGTVTLTEGNWHWVTIKVISGGTCLLRVYNTSETLIGSEQSCTGKSNNWQYFNFGILQAIPGMSDTNIKFYWDDIVMDWTDATYPLLGWESGGRTTKNARGGALGMEHGMSLRM